MDYSDVEDVEDDLLGPEDLFMDECEEDDEKSSVKEINKEEEENDEDKKEDAKKKTKEVKKKREVKSSRVKLNADTLMGPHGLRALKKSFENFTFKGTNHEKEDLTRIMQILHHWMTYQLFPSGTFESTMAQLEVLGHKKNVQTYMKKIRMGIDEWGETKLNVDDDEKDDVVNLNEEQMQRDNFDQWLNHQMDIVNSDDDLSDTELPLAQPTETTVTMTELPSSQASEPHASQSEPEIVLTQEQLERIARNKKLAEERRLKRMSALENRMETSESSSQLEQA